MKNYININLESDFMEFIHQLELVKVVFNWWDFWLESLSLSNSSDDFDDLVFFSEWISWKDIPVMEDRTWEGLSSGVRSQVSGES